MNGVALQETPLRPTEKEREADRHWRIATWLRMGQASLELARFMHAETRFPILLNAACAAVNVFVLICLENTTGFAVLTLALVGLNGGLTFYMCRYLLKNGWTALDIVELEAANASLFRYMLANDIEPLERA